MGTDVPDRLGNLNTQLVLRAQGLLFKEQRSFQTLFMTVKLRLPRSITFVVFDFKTYQTGNLPVFQAQGLLFKEQVSFQILFTIVELRLPRSITSVVFDFKTCFSCSAILGLVINCLVCPTFNGCNCWGYHQLGHWNKKRLLVTLVIRKLHSQYFHILTNTTHP